MDLVNNGDKERLGQYVRMVQKNRYAPLRGRVHIEGLGRNMLVQRSYGGYRRGHDIIIKYAPFNWLGLKRIAPFHQRVQDAVDKLQLECDDEMRQTIREFEMNQQLNPRTPPTPPQGGSGVPPKTTTEVKKMEAKELNKRVKIFRASKEAIVDSVQRLYKYIDIVQHQELPEGYEVLGVTYNPAYRAFDFVVAHESFPMVGEGCKLEIIGEDMATHTYMVKPYRDNGYLPQTMAPEDARL